MLKQQHGFSLVELMISLVLGTLVIAMISSLYVSGVVNNINSIKYSRMKTDLQAVMHLMESDIRRAGYRGDAQAFAQATAASFAAGTISRQNPFMKEERITIIRGGVSKTVSAGKSTEVFNYSTGTNNCILLKYDIDSDGILDSNENVGYRFADGVVELGSDATTCATGTWQEITDKNFLTISNLSFTETDVRQDYVRLRQVKIVLEGATSIASKTASDKLSSLVQVRNLEMYR